MATPKTLREAILFFANYDNCHRAVSEIRWPDGVVRCPHCGSENVTYMESVRRWKCYTQHAKPQFSLKVGTIFEDSAVGLEKWLPALWLLTTCKNGISSYELARALGVTQKTAWFMLSRLRLALQRGAWGTLDRRGRGRRDLHRRQSAQHARGQAQAPRDLAAALDDR